MNDIEKTIYDFMMEQKKSDTLTTETELFKSKYITSLFALQIVVFVEDTFKIKLQRKDISEKNFHTIKAIAQLVEKYKQN